MAGVAFQDQREFRCNHCSGKILVPRDMPPMTGPCPHCGSTITSPDPQAERETVQQVSAMVEVPAVVVTERVEVPASRGPSGPPPLPPSAIPKPAESRYAPPPAEAPKQEPVAKAVSVSPFASPASPAFHTPPPPLIRVEPVDLPDSIAPPDMTYLPGRPSDSHAAAAREAAERDAANAREVAAKEAGAREAAEKEIALFREAAAKEASAREAAEKEAAAAREAAAKEAAAREAAAREAATKEIAAAREAAAREIAAAREAAEKEAAAAREAGAREAAAAREAAEKEAAVREAVVRATAAREAAAREAAEKEAAAVREATAQATAAKELAAREAAAREVAAAREAAAKEVTARQAAEREAAAARETAAKEAAARAAAAKEAAARAAAAKEAAAREAAVRETAAKEAAARKAAEREAAAAREVAAKEAAAREAAEREAAARETAAREAAAKESALKEAAARQAAERQAAVAREEIARATAAREAILKEATAKEAAARAAAEREVAAAREAAAKEAAEREAIAREAAAKEAAAKAAAARAQPRTVVSIGLGHEPPSRPVPVESAPEPVVAQPEPAREIPRTRPVEAPPAAPLEVAPVQPEIPASSAPETEQRTPMLGRVSIGLSDEALSSVRPPSSAPPGRMPDPVSIPAPSVLAADQTGAPKSVRSPRKQSNRSRKGLVLTMLFLLLLMFVVLAAALHFIKKMSNPTFADSGAQRNSPAGNRPGLHDPNAWQEEARQALSEFLNANTPAGKAAFSIRGSELLPRMISFYGPGPIDDSDTPLSGFATENLPPEDHKRGIYRMTFDRPPQFELKEFFGPIAPLEVQMKVEEPDLLLSSLARVGNFTSEPVKVDVFFKRTLDGLKIDWETFVQTKYRTFRNFTELADPGQSGVFRVFVMEDVPEKGRATIGHKTYKVIDPAYRTDSVRLEVPVDSELGRALSKVNWLGVKDARPVTKTATIELEWTTGASPRLAIKRFLCWEFLGIGGEAVPGASSRGGR